MKKRPKLSMIATPRTQMGHDSGPARERNRANRAELRAASRRTRACGLLDPDPFTTAAFVVAAVTLSIHVFRLVHDAAAGQEARRVQLRKLHGIATDAERIARGLRQDVDRFESIWRPSILVIGGVPHALWDLDAYAYTSYGQILSRASKAHKGLSDIQNRIGALDLDDVGDSWRVHAIEGSVQLLRTLASISNVEDFASLASTLRQLTRDHERRMQATRQACAKALGRG